MRSLILLACLFLTSCSATTALTQLGLQFKQGAYEENIKLEVDEKR